MRKSSLKSAQKWLQTGSSTEMNCSSHILITFKLLPTHTHLHSWTLPPPLLHTLKPHHCRRVGSKALSISDPG